MGMTKEDVLKIMKKKNVVILNVLPEDDFLKLHIQGSHNRPLSQNRSIYAGEIEKEFGKDKFFITYSADITCAAGPNAAQALKTRGFNAQDYSGGMKEWREAGFPVEGVQARQTASLR